MPDAPLPASEPSQQGTPPYVKGRHGRAVIALTRAIRDREILLFLTGPGGVGKSTVLNAVFAGLADGQIRVVRLSNPGAPTWSRDQLVAQILGRPRAVVTDSAISAAIEQLTSMDHEPRVVLVVDDAHTLADDALELLLQAASPVRGSGVAPQLILSGRDRFWEREWRAELQLIARLAERVTLDALTGPDARDYVAFRFQRTRSSIHDVITYDGLAELLRHAHGLPGSIDRILAASMSITACRGTQTLDGEVVAAAVASLASVLGRPLLDATPSMAVPPAAGPQAADAEPESGSPEVDSPGELSRLAALIATSSPASVRPAGRPLAELSSPAFFRSRAADPEAVERAPVRGATPRMPSIHAPPPETGGAISLRTNPTGLAQPAPKRRWLSLAAAVAMATVLVASGVATLLPRPWPRVPGIVADALPDRAPPDQPTAPPKAIATALAGGALPVFVGDRRNMAAEAAPPSDSRDTPVPATPAAVAAANIPPAAPPAQPSTVDSSGLADGALGSPPAPSRAATETPVVTPAVVSVDQPKSPAPLSAAELKRLDLEAGQALRDGRMDVVREKMEELRRQVERLKQARVSQVPDAKKPPVNDPARPAASAAAATPASAKPASGANDAPPEGPSKGEVPSGVVAAADSPVAPNPSAEEPTRAPAPAQVAVVAPAVTAVSGPDTPPDAAKAETPPPAPTTGVTPSSQELVASLLRHGDAMLNQGDVLSARLFFERAASAGSGQGAISAGRTYDPNYLATIEVLGLKADAARAREWYRTASALGDRDADGLLKALGPQTGQ